MLFRSKDKNINIIKGLVITTLLHGTYDFLIFTGNMILVCCDLVLLILMFVYANYKIKKLIEIDKSNLIKTNYCPNCGEIIEYEFCPKCGYKKNTRI